MCVTRVGFFDICDEDNNGAISEKEFYNVLKLNIINDRDKRMLRQTVREIFNSVRNSAHGELSRFAPSADQSFRKELSAAIRSNAQIKDIIEKNMRILNDVDRWISSDLAKPFQTRMALSLSAYLYLRTHTVGPARRSRTRSTTTRWIKSFSPSRNARNFAKSTRRASEATRNISPASRVLAMG